MTIIESAFADWFGLPKAQALAMARLHEGRGRVVTMAQLLMAMGQSATVNSAMNVISHLRAALDADAIETVCRESQGDTGGRTALIGYRLTESGQRECREALQGCRKVIDQVLEAA